MSKDKLIHRLNRANGQLEAVKRMVENDANCLETLQQLKASINALKKFGEAYTQDHLNDCLEKGMSTSEAKAALSSVITGAFSL